MVLALVTITLLERLEPLFCATMSSAVRFVLIPLAAIYSSKALPREVSLSRRIYRILLPKCILL